VLLGHSSPFVRSGRKLAAIDPLRKADAKLSGKTDDVRDSHDIPPLDLDRA